MSYTQEQHEKNQMYVESQMADCSGEDRADVMRECVRTWPDDNEIKNLVANKKKEISMRASDQEIDDVFKNLRV